MRTVHTGNTVVRGSCYAALPFWYASNTKALLLLANEGKLSLKHTNNVPGNPLSIAEQLLFLKEGIKKKSKKIGKEGVVKPGKPFSCLSKRSQLPFQGWWKSNIELKNVNLYLESFNKSKSAQTSWLFPALVLWRNSDFGWQPDTIWNSQDITPWELKVDKS